MKPSIYPYQWKPKTGDMIVCKGDPKIDDNRYIIWGTFSEITHVGIVVELGGILYVAEFTVQNPNIALINIITKTKILKGGMVVSLKKRINAYEGEIFIKPINKQLDPEVILDWFKKHQYTPFQTGILQMLNSSLKLGSSFGRSDISELFCSEAYAQLLIDMKLLPSNSRASKFYTPNDIANLTNLENGYFYNDFLIPVKTSLLKKKLFNLQIKIIESNTNEHKHEPFFFSEIEKKKFEEKKKKKKKKKK